MRQLAKPLFLLALAGCSTSRGLFQQEEPKPVPLANSPMPPTVPQQASPNRSNSHRQQALRRQQRQTRRPEN